LIFRATPIAGAFVIEPEVVEDERGFFARTWCQREFEAHDLCPRLVQCSISFNHRKGTLRGMHYQVPPHAEVKLVRCTQGAIYDVIADHRMESPTFRQWYAVELSARNRHMLYIAEGLAHGFQTLEDETEVFYQMSEFHDAGAARGIRWDDPALSIRWPLVPSAMSAKDRSYPDWKP
jgi:dTDP-4-dehydrorhamnose 3,5-epimerase